MDLVGRINKQFNDNIQLTRQALDAIAPSIASAAELIVRSIRADGKILSCGNGGSAADAQHFSAELLNRFERDRPGLPAIALATDSSTLTSVANDYEFDQVFAKPIGALGRAGDILLAITTSGDSPNIIRAAEAAHRQDMPIVALTGRDGGKLSKQLAQHDIEIRVPSASTARTQEVHILVLHCLCELIDYQLLGPKE